ncbi:MAG: DUF262 domain-containing protein [Ruminococcus sp.]|nr:DUF262 domain-containing protein [Ruminococcus sp.]
MDINRGRIINDFIEPNKNQYAIPVYQRNYEWSREQCEKLFEDILKAYKRDKNHFCGSVVYAPLKEEHNIHYYVIVDGQQRLTTIYLLLKALIDSAETAHERESLEETVFNWDKYDTYDVDTASKLKLKPIKSDDAQLRLLMDNKLDEVEKSSGIWMNYAIFRELVEQTLQEDPNISVKSIYKGIEKLTCAKIRLDYDDNAQEIFERINSTGVPLSLADKIRNFVLMTEADQDELYEKYWLKIEQNIDKKTITTFFLDYLNTRSEGFVKENDAYERFKKYSADKESKEDILKEVLHYSKLYKAFLYGDKAYSDEINYYLASLKSLKQTTVYLFLFHVFDDYSNGIIDQTELEKVLKLLLGYSIRRLMCEIPSNSLRGFFKSLHARVFFNPDNLEHYYDAIVCFLQQITSRDVIPDDDDFIYALKNNNLYRKSALCRYLLIAIENQGKEKIVTDTLSIEHIMPQNKNLSKAWQQMLGDNWSEDRDKWLHTLGNLTLTGHNSELGDRPFEKKKEKLEEYNTKVVRLNKDILKAEMWNAQNIKKRAARLSKEVFKLFPIEKPEESISFVDPRYVSYTCADSSNATSKIVSYYELLGERVNVDSFATMLRSVVRKLYDLDSEIIESLARNNHLFSGSYYPFFSYDKSKAHNPVKIPDTEIYMSSGFSAAHIIRIIKQLINAHGLDIESDFVYVARSVTNK